MLRRLAGAADFLRIRESLAIFAQAKTFDERDLTAIVEGVRFDDLYPIFRAGGGVAATAYTAFCISAPTAAPPPAPHCSGFQTSTRTLPHFLCQLRDAGRQPWLDRWPGLHMFQCSLCSLQRAVRKTVDQCA